MKTLVLNTLGNDYTEQIKTLIKDKEVEIVDTSNMKIAHCMGCNQCWLKTPGICAIKDDYEEIIKKLVETENLWIVSDTHFGFLDYKGKRVMDRIVPMLNMTVGFRDGWMRHEMRYHPLNIIDCPAILPVSDTMLWGKYIPRTIFLVRYGKTNARLARIALDKLHQAGVKVLGGVIGQHKSASLTYGYYKSYKYEYKAKDDKKDK